MFSLESLHSQDFTWKTALSTALASQLAYHPAKSVEHVATKNWSLGSCKFIEAASTQCFVAASDKATLVAFRGTESFGDWITDLSVLSTSRDYGTIHSGFCKAYEKVRDEIREVLVAIGTERALVLTGHSLGGALAVIAAADLWDSFPATSVYTFGQPRAGKTDLTEFAKDRFASKYFRFVNDSDLITRVPPGYQHFGNFLHFDGSGQLKSNSVEAAGAPNESPALTTEEFDQLKAKIGDAREKAAATYTSAELAADDREAVLNATVEGLIPGFSDHKLDRYIANVRRLALESSVSNFDRTLEVAQEFLASNSASEAVRSSLGGAHSVDGTPILVRLRSADWTPPEGLKIQTRIGVFVTAHAQDASLTRLKSDPNVVSVEASRDAGTQECGESMPFLGVPAVHQPESGAEGERGDKALVGVVDTGIDIKHEAFLDAGGGTRIRGIWNQRDPSGPTPSDVDATFTQSYGTFYDQQTIQRMLQGEIPIPHALRDPSQDALGNPRPGHGTHVASIAVGRPVGTFAGGVAPEAGMFVVIPNMITEPGSPPSVGYSNSHIDAIAFLRTATSREDLPMAVNVSLGMNAGAHDGLSSLESAFDALTDNGRLKGFAIVKSAGNEGDSAGHARLQAGQGQLHTFKWQSEDRFRTQDYIEVWYNEWQDLGFKLTAPPTDDASAQTESAEVSVAAPVWKGVLNGNHCTLAMTFPHPDNGEHLLQLTILPDTAAIRPGEWQLSVTGKEVVGEAVVHAWVERHRNRAVRFSNQDANVTLSIPGTAEHVITVAACGSSEPITVPDFSSRGRTRNGNPKPDVCAPGELVIAAASNSPDTQAVVAMPGTSMAAPHVAGAIALAFSVRAKSGKPQLNANQVRAALKKSTKGATGVHNPATGFGALDIGAFMEKIQALP